jgi:hypothetical protein
MPMTTTDTIQPTAAEVEAARVELTHWISRYVTAGRAPVHPLQHGIEIDGRHIATAYLWDNVCRYVALSERPVEQWTEAARERLPGILVELAQVLAAAEGKGREPVPSLPDVGLFGDQTRHEAAQVSAEEAQS